MQKKALFAGVRFLIRAESLALNAGIECQLKTVIGPPESPCGMKLVFPAGREAELARLWQDAGLQFKIEDE